MASATQSWKSRLRREVLSHLIAAAAGLADAELQRRIDSIYDLMLDLFGAAGSRETSPLTVANERAEVVLRAAAS